MFGNRGFEGVRDIVEGLGGGLLLDKVSDGGEGGRFEAH